MNTKNIYRLLCKKYLRNRKADDFLTLWEWRGGGEGEYQQKLLLKLSAETFTLKSFEICCARYMLVISLSACNGVVDGKYRGTGVIWQPWIVQLMMIFMVLKTCWH